MIRSATALFAVRPFDFRRLCDGCLAGLAAGGALRRPGPMSQCSLTRQAGSVHRLAWPGLAWPAGLDWVERAWLAWAGPGWPGLAWAGPASPASVVSLAQ